MTKEEYRAERSKRGLTQSEIGKLLGVHLVTISRRETGIFKISREAETAIAQLPENPPKKKRK